MNRRWVLFVGVFCGTDVFTGVCAFVLYFTLYLVMHSCCTYISHLFYFLHLNQKGVPPWYVVSDPCVSKLLRISSSKPLTSSCHHARCNQYWYDITTGGVEGTTGEIWKIIQSVKILSLNLVFHSNEIKVTVSFNCYNNSDNIALVNLQWRA